MISPYVWEATLPVRVPGLVRVLARVHALLDDWLFAPFVPLFDPRMGRPSTPMETYLPMMSQVPLTGWDTRAEAYTKAFKEVENPAVVTSKAMVPTGQFEVYSNSLRTPEGPLPSQATTGLTPEQFNELIDRVGQRLVWDSGRGRPRELTLRQAVKAVIMYFRINVTQEVIAELLFVDQSTISRVTSDLEEIIAEALDEFVPELPEEIEGRVAVVDGSLCPC